MKKVYDDATIARMVHDRDVNHLTYKQLADKYGGCEATAMKWVAPLSNYVRPPVGRPRSLTKRQANDAAKKYNAGWTLRMIAGHFGISYATAHLYISRHPSTVMRGRDAGARHKKGKQ
jgi:transposase